ncbi:hypothetical protein RSAG8_08180, partial [Rhizoctonia solani AG-8 WAC10335]
MAAFKREIVREFGRAFPYRHPDNDVSHFPAELQALQITDRDEWEALGEKFRHRLNYLKGHHDDEADETNDGQLSQGLDHPTEMAGDASATDGASEVEEETVEETPAQRTSGRLFGQLNSAADKAASEEAAADSQCTGPSSRVSAGKNTAVTCIPTIGSGAWVGTSTKTKSNPTTDDQTYPAPVDFKPPTCTVKNWRDALDQLSAMVDLSWAECSSCELKAQLEEVPYLCASLASLLACGNGAKVYRTGVTVARSEYTTFHTTSPHSYHFLSGPEAEGARDNFSRFVFDSIGAGMCVASHCPAPVMHADVNWQNHPLFPAVMLPSDMQNRFLAFQYLSLKLQWQGGGADVLYSIIAQEAKMESAGDVRPQYYDPYEASTHE